MVAINKDSKEAEKGNRSGQITQSQLCPNGKTAPLSKPKGGESNLSALAAERELAKPKETIIIKNEVA